MSALHLTHDMACWMSKNPRDWKLPGTNIYTLREQSLGGDSPVIPLMWLALGFLNSYIRYSLSVIELYPKTVNLDVFQDPWKDACVIIRHSLLAIGVSVCRQAPHLGVETSAGDNSCTPTPAADPKLDWQIRKICRPPLSAVRYSASCST